LIGNQPIKVVVNSDMPASIAVGQPTGAFNIQAISTVPEAAAQGLNLVGATTIEGTAVSGDEVLAPEGTVAVNVPVTIPQQPVPNPPAAFDITATGQTPSLTFSQPGTATINVKTLNLTLTPRNAQGQPTSLGTFDSACTLDTGQPIQLHQFQITGGTTTTTTGTTTTGTTTTGTTTTGTTTTGTTTTGTTTTTTGTTTTTTTGTATTTPTTTTTGTTTTTPTTTTTTTGPPPTGVEVSYDLSGQTVLRKLHGSVRLTGGFDAVADLAAGTYTGDLTLDPATGRFRLFGFLPVRADMAFVQVGTSGGTVTPGSITFTGHLTTKLTRLTLFGIPLYQGDSCQTVSPSEIKLTSVDTFDVFKGGILRGHYDLSGVKGCGPLNDFISPFIESTGNTLNIRLTGK
jgi:hypothetical protein